VSARPQLSIAQHNWLEAELQHGDDEESLMRAIAAECTRDPNRAWDILSQLDQLYRRKRIPEHLFHRVKQRTEKLALGTPAAAPSGRPRVLRSRFELMEQLGHGGSGSVYKALDRLRADLPSEEQYVAIKLLHDSGRANSQQLAEVLRECHHAQALSHPNIVHVYDVDRDRDQAFLIMELLQGMPLDRLLRELPAHRLPVPQALAVIRDAGAAVAYAHSRHVIHGDLKPQHVIIEFDSTLRVLDFGVSRHWRSEPWISEPSDRGGSPATPPRYASCELLRGEVPEPRDDLYALACIAYELIAGEHPFAGHTAVTARQHGLRAARPAGLTRQQWRALRSALSWERERRSPSVSAWLAQMQLDQAAERLTPLSTLLHATAPHRTASARWLLTGVAGIVMLAAVRIWGPRPDMRIDFPRSQTTAQTVRLPAPAAATFVEPPTTNVAPEASSAEPPSATATPTIELATERILVPEGAVAAQITIRRSGSSRGDIGFLWWIEPGTARPGTDYIVDSPQHARISDGQESTTLFVPLIKDTTLRGDAEFYVHIGSPTGASLGGPMRGTVQIVRGR
jgi:serine/threonine protein kinase